MSAEQPRQLWSPVHVQRLEHVSSLPADEKPLPLFRNESSREMTFLRFRMSSQCPVISAVLPRALSRRIIGRAMMS